MTAYKKFINAHRDVVKSHFICVLPDGKEQLYYAADYGAKIDHGVYYQHGGDPLYSPVILPVSLYNALREVLTNAS